MCAVKETAYGRGNYPRRREAAPGVDAVLNELERSAGTLANAA